MRPFGPGARPEGVADLARCDDRIGARASYPADDRVAAKPTFSQAARSLAAAVRL